MILILIALFLIVCCILCDIFIENRKNNIYCGNTHTSLAPIIPIVAIVLIPLMIYRVDSCESSLNQKYEKAMIAKNYIEKNDISSANANVYDKCLYDFNKYNNDVIEFRENCHSFWVGWFYCDAAEKFETLSIEK